MFSNDKYAARFLNEELRNSDTYFEGTELRKLA